MFHGFASLASTNDIPFGATWRAGFQRRALHDQWTERRARRASRRDGFHSKRRISTGRMRAADQAGTIVAPMQMTNAAAAIQIASSALE